MNKTLYSDENLSVFKRLGRFFIRYDAGSHQVEIREDEISENEAEIAASSEGGATKVLFALQKRLLDKGVDPYKSNV